MAFARPLRRPRPMLLVVAIMVIKMIVQRKKIMVVITTMVFMTMTCSLNPFTWQRMVKLKLVLRHSIALCRGDPMQLESGLDRQT